MPTTSAGLKYEELEQRLLVGRNFGTLAVVDEEALLDAMDTLWWKMTDEERAEADERPVTISVAAPVDLGGDNDPEQVRGWPHELVAA